MTKGLIPSAAKVWTLAAVLFTGVTLVVGCFVVLVVRWSHPPLADLVRFAELGESFGLISALFSGLAFAGLIITIRFQSRELALQREQLTLQRDELAAQRAELQRLANAQDDQNYVLLISAFTAAEMHNARTSAGGPSPEFGEVYRHLHKQVMEQTAKRSGKAK